MLKLEHGNEALTDGQTDARTDEPTIRYIRGYALCGKNHYVATNLKWQNSIQVSSGNSSTKFCPIFKWQLF